MTLLYCLLVACLAQSPRLEAPARGFRKPEIWDFALRKLNPANVDYGAELERRREVFFHQFRDPRLCLEATGLSSMLAAWTLVIRKRREKLRREILTAELLAQYHNALAETRIRLEQAIADNVALREAAPAVIASPPLENSLGDDSVSPAELYLGSNFSPRRSRRPTANATRSLQTNARLTEVEQQLSESRAREKLLEKELERIPAQSGSSPPPRAPAASPRGKTPL